MIRKISLLFSFFLICSCAILSEVEPTVVKKSHLVKRYDFFAGWERNLFTEVTEVINIKGKQLLNFKEEFAKYTLAKRKIYLYSNIQGYCCQKKRNTWVKRFFLDYKEEIIEAYSDFGYPEKEIIKLRKYLSSFDKPSGNPYYNLKDFYLEGKTLPIKEKFILENIDSIIFDEFGNPFNLNFSGWVYDTLNDKSFHESRKGVYKARIINGELIEKYHFRFDGTLLRKRTFYPANFQQTFYFSGKIRSLDSLKSEDSFGENWISKTFHPNGQVFQEGWETKRTGTSKSHWINEMEKGKTYFPNGQLAFKRNGISPPTSLDSLGNNLIENGSGQFYEWELNDFGSQMVKTKGEYKDAEPSGTWEYFDKGKLKRRKVYGGEETYFYESGKIKQTVNREGNLTSKFDPPLDQANFLLKFDPASWVRIINGDSLIKESFKSYDESQVLVIDEKIQIDSFIEKCCYGFPFPNYNHYIGYLDLKYDSGLKLIEAKPFVYEPLQGVISEELILSQIEKLKLPSIPFEHDSLDLIKFQFGIKGGLKYDFEK